MLGPSRRPVVFVSFGCGLNIGPGLMHLWVCGTNDSFTDRLLSGSLMDRSARAWPGFDDCNSHGRFTQRLIKKHVISAREGGTDMVLMQRIDDGPLRISSSIRDSVARCKHFSPFQTSSNIPNMPILTQIING